MEFKSHLVLYRGISRVVACHFKYAFFCSWRGFLLSHSFVPSYAEIMAVLHINAGRGGVGLLIIVIYLDDDLVTSGLE